MTWKELLSEAAERLKRAGIEECEVDAWYLFSEAFDMSRAQFFLCRDREIPAEQWDDCAAGSQQTWRDAEDESLPMERFVHMIGQRSRRIPLQQIIGHQEFMGLDFLVNEHVLCPRQDTEVLVETVLGELKELHTEERLRILDMCAGSGCIGISLERLAEVPVEVMAADISEEAIKVAAANARKNGCEHYCILKSDLFEEIAGEFQVIVSNPPYIPSAVIETLEDEVRCYEPRLALDGEADGLSFYHRISESARGYLMPGGRIYYEIGYDQGQSVSEILAENGFVDIRVIKDLAELDRVVTAKLQFKIDGGNYV